MEDIRVDSLCNLEQAYPPLFQFIACTFRVDPVQGVGIHENLVAFLERWYWPSSFVEMVSLFVLHFRYRSPSAIPVHG